MTHTDISCLNLPLFLPPASPPPSSSSEDRAGLYLTLPCLPPGHANQWYTYADAMVCNLVTQKLRRTHHFIHGLVSAHSSPILLFGFRHGSAACFVTHLLVKNVQGSFFSLPNAQDVADAMIFHLVTEHTRSENPGKGSELSDTSRERRCRTCI